MKANDAELVALDWEDNPSQTIDWEKELKPTLIKMHTVRQSGGSVVVRFLYLFLLQHFVFNSHKTHTHRYIVLQDNHVRVRL